MHLPQISTSSSSSAAPPSSVFFLGGSVEFPNLSFSSELTNSTSPQFRLQTQALNHYVSGTFDMSATASPLSDTFWRLIVPVWLEADPAAPWFTTAGFQKNRALLPSCSFPFPLSCALFCILIHMLFTFSTLPSISLPVSPPLSLCLSLVVLNVKLKQEPGSVCV